jgi:glyoxylase-like metal-dependent hydrolase (beta-lactamase superfamily II)
MLDVDITPLRIAEVTLPDFHPEAPGSCAVFVFLVRDGDFHVLVDTGVGEGSGLIDHLYEPRRTDLVSALSSANVSPAEIGALVNSHLHFDHCGNNRLFPGVPTFVQEDEMEAARQSGYTVAEWVEFEGAHYELVRGRRSISTHLELVPTPGHTPGHQSVLVRSGSGTDLIVAQAAYTAKEFESSRSRDTGIPEGTWSRGSYRESLSALHRLGIRRAFFSHDSTVWLGAGYRAANRPPPRQ